MARIEPANESARIEDVSGACFDFLVDFDSYASLEIDAGACFDFLVDFDSYACLELSGPLTKAPRIISLERLSR